MTSDPSQRNQDRRTPMQGSASGHDARSDVHLATVTAIARISVVVVDGDAVVSAIGELDISNANRFGEVLACVRDRHAGRIVVDLAKTAFVDLSIVEVLEHERREAPAPLVVTNARGIVKRLFELAGFDTHG
jgi:anti-anti-sigma factor